MSGEMNAEARFVSVEKTLERIEEKLDDLGGAVLKTQADHEDRLRKIEAARPECIAQHGERITQLENKGAKRWETLIGTILSLIAAGFIGWVLSGLRV